ncbi:imidazole glycerol phosphate synthase subunit HisH [bacterium F11]|nr:imidazole glycerol phosphate synthase subunit HisH [bacterium F11]
MKPRVGVIDYGMGNLHSVSKALALQGANVTVTDDVEILRQSDMVVLPGVGSFGAAAQTLRKKGLDTFVKDWIGKNRPYLGICLGFQLLFDSSEEDPQIPGLGILKGSVVRFRFPKGLKAKNKVPHMGWNTTKRAIKKKEPYFKNIKDQDYFYFVHTFYPVPEQKSNVFTTTTYGIPFCSSVSRGNLFASQFHPEKSGEIGLKLLKNILASLRK